MSEVSLTGWMKALIAYVRSGEPDLTNRQMALLMLVYLTPGPHTVRGLARVLGVSKPVHVMVPSVTARGIVNMTALAVSQAASQT